MAEMFYIENTEHGGDCRLFWKIAGRGYTRDLDKAWQVTHTDGKRICQREADVLRSVKEMEKDAIRHVPR